jgi:hypothetical protein
MILEVNLAMLKAQTKAEDLVLALKDLQDQGAKQVLTLMDLDSLIIRVMHLQEHKSLLSVCLVVL